MCKYSRFQLTSYQTFKVFLGHPVLLEKIEHDEQLPVLQIISREQGFLGKVIAALYVITGNGQVSHFYKVFFNNVDFITRGSVNIPGSLGDLYGDFVLDPETETNALCSVIRLISCVYLNKNKLAFPPKTTAEALLSQIDTGNILANHKRLSEVIRDKIWPRVTSESQLPPSVTYSFAAPCLEGKSVFKTNF